MAHIERSTLRSMLNFMHAPQMKQDSRKYIRTISSELGHYLIMAKTVCLFACTWQKAIVVHPQ